MKNKKLKIERLNVQSFLTELDKDALKTVQGQSGAFCEGFEHGLTEEGNSYQWVDCQISDDTNCNCNVPFTSPRATICASGPIWQRIGVCDPAKDPNAVAAPTTNCDIWWDI